MPQSRSISGLVKDYYCQAQGPTQGPTQGQGQCQGQDMVRSVKLQLLFKSVQMNFSIDKRSGALSLVYLAENVPSGLFYP